MKLTKAEKNWLRDKVEKYANKIIYKTPLFMCLFSVYICIYLYKN